MATQRWEIDYRNLAFLDRLEVRNAVRRGRRVDDRALAPIAVWYARLVQDGGRRWWWSFRDALLGAIIVAHAAVAAVFLPWWAVVPVALGLVGGAGFRFGQASAREHEHAEEAESENLWIVENYLLLDERSRSRLRPRRFRTVRRLLG